MKNISKNYFPEFAGVLFCVTLGMFSGYIAHSGDTLWYQTLIKPDFNPPSWIFAPVWTILYIMMGFALGQIIKIQNNRILRLLFVTQFTCNIIWSYLFFRIHRIDLALYDLTALWIALLALLVASYRHRTIFLLLVPYFAWTTFAFLLNYKIYIMNV